MHDKNELCQKIKSIYPDIGECGIDIDVDFDGEQDMYVVDLKKGSRHVKHHLDQKDADLCMDGKQCVSLGLEIGQFRDT